jgi:hypothetical protein
MKWVTSRVTWGLVLIAAGALALLVNLSVIPESSWLWAAAFGAVGVYFLFVFFSSRENWWAAFPAFGALGITGTIIVAEVSTWMDELAGAVFLGAVSLAFFAIYIRRPDNWWALIPGGATLAIAAVVLASAYENVLPGDAPPVILFAGMGLTFLLVYFTRSESGRNRWAIWPALGLFALALVTGVAVFDLAGYVLPVVLIGAGLVILLRRR